MKQSFSDISLNTNGEGFTNITSNIESWISQMRFDTGILLLSIKHTSCSLLINENADPRVLDDLSRFMKAIVPEEGIPRIFPNERRQPYNHAEEGPDDMPAHIRTALTATSIGLSIEKRTIVLGSWQGVYLWEHRYSNHVRKVRLHAIGDFS